LEGLGVGKIYFAADGERGFEIFQRDAPDIVFVDWDMGPVDGLTLTQRIRRYPLSVNRQVPIIMLTGYNATFRVEQARDSGATEFMTKPFTADAVAKRLAHVINSPRDFVKYSEFTGPDRRRRKEKDYTGEDRRGRNPADAASFSIMPAPLRLK
jgi:CheY-like chemotaxis protein